MVAFNPDIPETPEPNYLRYSRPSNFAPINKGAGEAIKGVADTVSMGLKATDSIVKSGISSYVNTQASQASDDFIHGQLEPRYAEVTGHNVSQGANGSLITTDNTPKDIKDLPNKVDVLSAYKAKGGYVPTEYQSKIENLAKDLRSKYPGYTNVIDQNIARFTGGAPANAYAHSLLAGINAAESKIDNEQKRQETMIDTFYKEGNISPARYALYKQGKMSPASMINEGGITAYQNKQWEMVARRNTAVEGEYKLDATTAEHAADTRRDQVLAQTFKDISAVKGTDTTKNFLQYKDELESGKRPFLSPEEQKMEQQSYDLIKSRYQANLAKDYTDSGLASKMGSEAYSKKLKEAGEAFDHYMGYGDRKEYVMQHSYQKWMETKTEGEKMALELADTGQLMRRAAMATKLSGSNAAIERKVGEELGTDKGIGKGLHSFMYDTHLGAVTAVPGKEGGSAPSVHTTVQDLNRLGFKGNAISMAINGADMIQDPKIPDEAKRNLIDYHFAGEGAKLLPSLAKESPIPRPGIDYTVSSTGRPITKGRYHVWDGYVKPEMVDAVHKLGGQSWQTYKDYVTSSTRTMLGSEIPDLNKYAEQGYKFGWDSKHNQLSIEAGQGQTNLDTGEITPNRVTPFIRKEVDNVNRILAGIKNVATKEPNIDVNAYLLKALQEGGLGDNKASQAIMQAIISSHKSSAPQPAGPQGQTMNDAGNQMGMGATAENVSMTNPLQGLKEFGQAAGKIVAPEITKYLSGDQSPPQITPNAAGKVPVVGSAMPAAAELAKLGQLAIPGGEGALGKAAEVMTGITPAHAADRPVMLQEETDRISDIKKQIATLTAARQKATKDLGPKGAQIQAKAYDDQISALNGQVDTIFNQVRDRQDSFDKMEAEKAKAGQPFAVRNPETAEQFGVGAIGADVALGVGRGIRGKSLAGTLGTGAVIGGLGATIPQALDVRKTGTEAQKTATKNLYDPEFYKNTVAPDMVFGAGSALFGHEVGSILSPGSKAASAATKAITKASTSVARKRGPDGRFISTKKKED